MKNYQNKITINDEEYYVRTEPVIVNAGKIFPLTFILLTQILFMISRR